MANKEIKSALIGFVVVIVLFLVVKAAFGTYTYHCYGEQCFPTITPTETPTPTEEITPTEEATPSATATPEVVFTGVSDGRHQPPDGRHTAPDGLGCAVHECFDNKSGQPLLPASNAPK